MEFYENRPRQPFIGFVQLRRALKGGGCVSGPVRRCDE